MLGGVDVINVKLQLRLAKETSCVGYLCLSGTNKCVTLMKIHLVYQEKKNMQLSKGQMCIYTHIYCHMHPYTDIQQKAGI